MDCWDEGLRKAVQALIPEVEGSFASISANTTGECTSAGGFMASIRMKTASMGSANGAIPKTRDPARCMPSSSGVGEDEGARSNPEPEGWLPYPVADPVLHRSRPATPVLGVRNSLMRAEQMSRDGGGVSCSDSPTERGRRGGGARSKGGF